MIASRPLGFLGSSFFDPHTNPATRRSLYWQRRFDYAIAFRRRMNCWASSHSGRSMPIASQARLACLFPGRGDPAAGQTALAAKILNPVWAAA